MLRDFEDGKEVRIEYNTNFERSFATAFIYLAESRGYMVKIEGNLLPSDVKATRFVVFTKAGVATEIPL